MDDVRRMTLGAVVDFCIDFNQRHETAEKEEQKQKKRKATQQDINAFFG